MFEQKNTFIPIGCEYAFLLYDDWLSPHIRSYFSIPIVQLHHIQFLSDKSHFSVYQSKIHRTNDDAHELRREEEGNRAEHGTDNPVISTSG